jgi:hypothetical protein
MVARIATSLVELLPQIHQEGRDIPRTVVKNRMRLPGRIARASTLRGFIIGIRHRHRSCHSMQPVQSHLIRNLSPIMVHLVSATTTSPLLQSDGTFDTVSLLPRKDVIGSCDSSYPTSLPSWKSTFIYHQQSRILTTILKKFSRTPGPLSLCPHAQLTLTWKTRLI